MDLLRPTWVEIDLDVIKHNVREIKKYINKETRLGAVIKANAYGHGAIEVARVLEKENVDYLCVASLNEAIELRYENINSPIFIMGYTPSKYFRLCIENNITTTIFSINQANELSKIACELNKVANIHIKIDTGFNRLGFKIDEEVEKSLRQIYNMENVRVEGIFSHLALKDKESDYEQFKKFKNILNNIHDLDIPIKHICDSIGMVAYKDFHMDMVRVGASLYGYNSRVSSLDLKEAITFKSRIIQIKSINKGEGIGYDYSFIADKYMKIGTVSCGYADGIPRSLSNKGYTFVNGKKCNIIGKICMDQCVIDLTHIQDINENDEVIFYGKNGPNLLDVADLCDTNRNEILSIVSRRVYRVYKEQNKIAKTLDYLKYFN